MTIEQRQQHRRTKAAVIAECASMIADRFGIDPSALFSPKKTNGHALIQSKAIFTHHLYCCGMSFSSIGRLMNRSYESVRKAESRGVILSRGRNREFVESLPMVPNTLEIVTAKSEIEKCPHNMGHELNGVGMWICLGCRADITPELSPSNCSSCYELPENLP